MDILKYKPMAIRIGTQIWRGTRLRNGSFSQEDLVQEGIFGIYEGYQTFDASLGVSEKTHISMKIRWSILRFLMDKGHLIRIPPYLHGKKARADLKQQALTNNLDFQYDYAGNVIVEERHSDILYAETKEEVAHLLSSLKPREQSILKMKYFDGLDGNQIGELYGITNNGVNMCVARSLAKLRNSIFGTKSA